jgi:hypothetical protein
MAPSTDASGAGTATPTRRLSSWSGRGRRLAGGIEPAQLQIGPLRELFVEASPHERLADLQLVSCNPRHRPRSAKYPAKLRGFGVVRFRIGGSPFTGW